MANEEVETGDSLARLEKRVSVRNRHTHTHRGKERQTYIYRESRVGGTKGSKNGGAQHALLFFSSVARTYTVRLARGDRPTTYLRGIRTHTEGGGYVRAHTQGGIKGRRTHICRTDVRTENTHTHPSVRRLCKEREGKGDGRGWLQQQQHFRNEVKKRVMTLVCQGVLNRDARSA